MQENLESMSVQIGSLNKLGRSHGGDRGKDDKDEQRQSESCTDLISDGPFHGLVFQTLNRATNTFSFCPKAASSRLRPRPPKTPEHLGFELCLDLLIYDKSFVGKNLLHGENNQPVTGDTFEILLPDSSQSRQRRLHVTHSDKAH